MHFDSETWQMTRAFELELQERRAARLKRLGPLPARPFRWAGLRSRLGGWRRPLAALEREGSVAMKWVTRERPNVDRIACSWLIKRFVDQNAAFLYVPANQVLAVAEREGATPYDVPNVELGHHGAECSFDAVIHKYGLTDPALAQLALIVRGADTEARDLTPESRGLVAIASGFRQVYQNDHEQVAAEAPVYDALYAWCQTQVAASGRS